MSRLASQADMEYVPSHPPTIAGLAGLFNNYDNLRNFAPIRLIDPCAGEGTALKTLEQAIRREFRERMNYHLPGTAIETYGVELDRERAGQARKVLGEVIQADYSNTVIADSAFSVMLLNPPYDYDPEYERLEQRFLVRSTKLLGVGGALIYIVPRYVLGVSADFLSRNYDNFRIWKADNPEARKFNQVMLVARRSLHPMDRLENEKAIGEFAEGRCDSVGDEKVCDFTRVGKEVDRFSALRIDYDDVLAEVARTGYETRREWRDIMNPPRHDIVQPLMPPRTGHMGLIMSGGGVGGLGIHVEDEDTGDRSVFRAASKKIVETTNENEQGTVQRISERMASTAVTLDPGTWEFEDDVQLGEFVSKWRKPLAQYISDVMPPKYTPQRLREILGGPPDYRRLLRQPMPGNGQRLAIEGAMFSLLSGEPGTIVVGEMGTGKTYISMSAAYLSGKRRVFALCPPTLVWKWEDEVLKTIPGARVHVVGRRATGPKGKQEFYKLYRNPMKQLRWLVRRYENDPQTPVFVIMAHSTAKMSYGRIPAVNWRWGYRPQPEYAETTGEPVHPTWRPFIEEYEADEDEANGRDSLTDNEAIVTAQVDDSATGNEASPETVAPQVVETDSADAQAEAAVEDEDGDRKKVMRLHVQRMCCPVCGQPLTNNRGEPVEWDWLARRRRTCINQITVGRSEFKDKHGWSAYGTISESCGSPLWQALTRTAVSRIDTGYPVRDERLRERIFRQYLYGTGVEASEALSYRGLGSHSPDYRPSMDVVADAKRREVFRTKQEPPRRFDLAEYIKRYLSDWCDLVIMDEVHQFKAGDSAQGMMARMLAELAPQSMSLTGTLMAGYARDLFNLLYAFGGRDIRHDFAHGEETRWRNVFGFVEKTIYLDAENSKRSRNRKNKERPKDLPGAMPGVLRYILGQAVFIRLLDVAAGLPDFSEHSITVELDETPDPVTGHTQKDNYQVMERRILEEIKSLTFTNPRAAQQLVSIFAQAVLSYPDCCTQEGAARIMSPADEHALIDRPPLSQDRVYPKEEKLLEIIEREKEAGRKVLVFCTHTRKRDVMPRLADLMDTRGIKPRILRSETVDADKRMEWLKAELENGLDALICHPQLVETGVDMLEFPTILWFEADYHTARVRQASRRSWRIGQTEPVRIYYLTYAESKQTQALYLIANKVATSLAVEGDLSSDGLSALAGGDSMGRSIAQMLVDGDFEFDGSFEAGINIAGLDSDAEGEALLVEDEQEWDMDGYETDDGLTPEVATQLVTQSLIPRDTGESETPEERAEPVDVAVPLFGTLETGEDIEVCTGCEQFIMQDEDRLVTPAFEIISSVDGVTTGPRRVFHSACYVPWKNGLQSDADSQPETEPVDEAAPDPADYGAVTMDAWMSAFELTTEDVIRGRPKRDRRRNVQEVEPAPLSLSDIH